MATPQLSPEMLSPEVISSEIATASISFSREAAPTSISVTRPVGTVLCLFLSDSLAVLVALLLGSMARVVLIGIPGTPVIRIFAPSVFLTLCCFIAARLYSGVSENPVEELRTCVLATLMVFLTLWSATYFFHDLSQSRITFLFGCVFSVFLVPCARAFTRMLFATKDWWGSPVAILGLGTTGKRIHEALRKNPRMGLKVVAVLDDNPAQYAHVDPKLIRGPLSRSLEVTREHRISYGIVCMPGLSRQELLALLDRYGRCFSHVMVIPNLIGMASLGIRVREVGGIIGLEVTRQLLRPSAKLTKRIVDLTLAAIIIPLSAPVMLVVAALIKLESPGPVFFANERIGIGGRKFNAWKLRSMVTNGEQVLREYLDAHPSEARTWLATQKLKRDPRITRIGRFIRRTSIDEIPQLWNVLKGEMSVVGPRPFLESQTEMYGPSVHLYKLVRPGITGLWQVSGRNECTFAERVAFDAYVIQNWSVWMDFYILARTFSVVFTARGAY